MRRKLLSERIERHLDRGEELMELNRAAFGRNERAFQRNEKAFHRNTEAFERMMTALDRFEARWEEREQRWEEKWEEREARFNQRLDENEQAMWEMTRRFEKVLQVLVQQNAEFNAEKTRRTDAIVAAVREFREDSRAHREALLALIDRLPPAAAA